MGNENEHQTLQRVQPQGCCTDSRMQADRRTVVDSYNTIDFVHDTLTCYSLLQSMLTFGGIDLTNSSITLRTVFWAPVLGFGFAYVNRP